MNNREKYVRAFKETFLIEESEMSGLKYQGINNWDSIGHMGLMVALEEAYNIELDIDDIINFSSFESGIEILAKYNLEMD